MDARGLKILAAIGGALAIATYGYSYGFNMAFGGVVDEAVERKDAFAESFERDPSKLVEMSELSEAEKAEARRVISEAKHQKQQDDFYAGFDDSAEN